MRGKKFLLVCLISLIALSAVMTGTVKAPVVLPKMYIDPPTSTAQPGEYFEIAVRVTDVSSERGVSGLEFLVRFDFALLAVDVVTEGDFLQNVGPTMFTVTLKPAESGYAIVCLLLIPETASGSGTLATIKFEVLDEGACPLDLLYTKLKDIDVLDIPHTAEGGYFSNTVIGNLVKKSAWPEHHHFSVSGDEDGIQTLYGKVKNLGEGHGYLRVMFKLFEMDGKIRTYIGKYNATMETKVMPGEEVNVSVDLWPSRAEAWAPGKYYVESVGLSSADGETWKTGEKVKTFSFAVVP